MKNLLHLADQVKFIVFSSLGGFAYFACPNYVFGCLTLLCGLCELVVNPAFYLFCFPIRVYPWLTNLFPAVHLKISIFKWYFLSGVVRNM